MKKSLLLFAALLILKFSKAQNIFPQSGNVGIGTISPSFPLHIIRPQYSNGALRIEGNATITGMPSINFYNNGDGTSANLAWDGTRFNFTTNLSVAGNVGINTTTPPTIGNYGVLALNGRTPSQGGYLSFQTNGTEIGAIVANSQFTIQTAANTTTSFFTGSMQTMQISPSGNVGIGTTTPDQKLTVNGTIHSTQVKVDLNVPGPDYVFKKGYNLPELSEIKSYIDKNHHLAEIPPAVQMEKNGIDLGEMNIKLLKKVEELTLYLIEKDKEDKILQGEMIALKRRIKHLESNKW